MAHELRSDPKDFARLEEVDSGSPKMTNLDEAMGPGVGVGASSAQSKQTSNQDQSAKLAGSGQESTNGAGGRHVETVKAQTELVIDKEDVVTVKYFPMKASKSAHSDVEKTSGRQAEESLEVSSGSGAIFTPALVSAASQEAALNMTDYLGHGSEARSKSSIAK